jgi:hypothetical protein
VLELQDAFAEQSTDVFRLALEQPRPAGVVLHELDRTVESLQLADGNRPQSVFAARLARVSTLRHGPDYRPPLCHLVSHTAFFVSQRSPGSYPSPCPRLPSISDVAL